MDGSLIVCGVALAIVIDVVMIVMAWRYLTCIRKRSCEAGAEYSVCSLLVDDDENAFDFAGDDRYSHGLLVNPASGLPMLDDVWMDVAGNPYGTSSLGLSCGGCESSSFGSGCNGPQDSSH